MEYSIGIYLGLNDACVGVWKNNKVVIIENDDGVRTTPATVSFTESELLIGQSAKNQIDENPSNTIYGIRKIIGRNFNDIVVQNFMKTIPYKIEKDENSDRPKIIVEYLGEKQSFLPEEILSMIIGRLKQVAKDYLGQAVENAVLTVPPYFNDSQRQAIKDAGRIAGLNILRLIDEPVAASIAYGLKHKYNDEKNILVFKMGSEESDISILSVENSLYEVIATRNDSNLGGNNFDEELMKYCKEKFKKDTGIDVANNKKAIRRLRIAVEKAIKNLSYTQETKIDLDAFAEGEELNLTITRPQFEDLCRDLFYPCIELISDTLKDAKLDKSQIDEIILTGGSTRIPKIQQIIRDYFNGKELNRSINPEEVCAYGATIQAFLYGNVEDVNLEK